jgi:hypothetical protein
MQRACLVSAFAWFAWAVPPAYLSSATTYPSITPSPTPVSYAICEREAVSRPDCIIFNQPSDSNEILLAEEQTPAALKKDTFSICVRGSRERFSQSILHRWLGDALDDSSRKHGQPAHPGDLPPAVTISIRDQASTFSDPTDSDSTTVTDNGGTATDSATTTSSATSSGATTTAPTTSTVPSTTSATSTSTTDADKTDSGGESRGGIIAAGVIFALIIVGALIFLAIRYSRDPLNFFNRRKQKRQRGYSVYSTVPLVVGDGGNKGGVDRESLMFSQNPSSSLKTTVVDSETPDPTPNLYDRPGESYIPLEQVDMNPSLSSQASYELNDDLASYYATVPASYFNSISSSATHHSLPGSQATDPVSPVYPTSIHDWRNSHASNYDPQVTLDRSHTYPPSYYRDGRVSPPS